MDGNAKETVAPALTPELPLNEIVRLRPNTLGVFHHYGMDACCGGSLPLGEAVRRHGLDLDEVVAALSAA